MLFRSWGSNGRYLRCVIDEVLRFKLSQLINSDEVDAIREAAMDSSCGERDPICE